MLPLACFVVWLLLLIAACDPAAPAATTPPPAGPEVGVIVITSDLSLGQRRVVFGLVDRDGFPVRPPAAPAGTAPTAQVRALYLPSGTAAGEARAAATARFLRWPAGEQGIYAAKLAFDRVGFWELEVTAAHPDGKPVVARGAVQIKEKTATPDVGDPAPPSNTLTAEGVADLATITSANPADPELYRLSIAQALKAGKPLVVAFASPAYCVSATCGPQVEVLEELKAKYGERANFIHVEVFQDPHLLKGGRAQGKPVPAVLEWGLPTEPWTFVINREGRIHARFEQFSLGEEIESALKEVL